MNNIFCKCGQCYSGWSGKVFHNSTTYYLARLNYYLRQLLHKLNWNNMTQFRKDSPPWKVGVCNIFVDFATFMFMCFGPVASMVRYGKLMSVWRAEDSSTLAFSAASRTRWRAMESFVKSMPWREIFIASFEW